MDEKFSWECGKLSRDILSHGETLEYFAADALFARQISYWIHKIQKHKYSSYFLVAPAQTRKASPEQNARKLSEPYLRQPEN